MADAEEHSLMNCRESALRAWRRACRPLPWLCLVLAGCGGGASLTPPTPTDPQACRTTVASGFTGDLNQIYPDAGGDSTGGDGGSGGSGDGGDGSGSAGSVAVKARCSVAWSR
jgi:hypothetical protein